MMSFTITANQSRAFALHTTMKPILPLLALILLTGCASVPMADTSLDYEAKKFNPESGKANIYINRGGGVGTALTLQTIFDGRITGTLAPHTYQLLSVPAGDHVVSIGGENQNAAQSKFKAELGKNYFFDVGFSMGWVSPRVHLEMVDEQTGRLELKDSKRAESSNY